MLNNFFNSSFCTNNHKKKRRDHYVSKHRQERHEARNGTFPAHQSCNRRIGQQRTDRKRNILQFFVPAGFMTAHPISSPYSQMIIGLSPQHFVNSNPYFHHACSNSPRRRRLPGEKAYPTYPRILRGSSNHTIHCCTRPHWYLGVWNLSLLDFWSGSDDLHCKSSCHPKAIT